MAASHVAVWPKVKVNTGEKGKTKVLAKGDAVPASVPDAEVANLLTFGAVAAVGADAGDEKPPAKPKSGS